MEVKKRRLRLKKKQTEPEQNEQKQEQREKINRKLLASFVSKKRYKAFVKYLYDNKICDHLFILKSDEVSTFYIFTYNLLKEEFNMSELKDYGCHHSFVLQRNRETNTLFSINALNYLVSEIRMITEQQDVRVCWEGYRDSLVVMNGGKPQTIPTKLYRKVNLANLRNINALILN